MFAASLFSVCLETNELLLTTDFARMMPQPRRLLGVIGDLWTDEIAKVTWYRSNI